MARFNFPLGSGGAPKAMAKKPTPKPAMDEQGIGGEHETAPDVHEHLAAMHAATGNAHSHIEHHEDGTHTSHHVDREGNVTGPHDHANLEALKSHMDQFLDEEGQEGDGGDEDGGEEEDGY